MKNLIYTLTLLLGFTSVSFSQDNLDQNPNFQKSLVKYDLQKNKASAEQSITLQNTYVVKDWREVKTEQKELKAERKHELRKMRIESNAQNRRYYNQNRGYNNQNCNNRYRRNYNSYYSY